MILVYLVTSHVNLPNIALREHVEAKERLLKKVAELENKEGDLFNSWN